MPYDSSMTNGLPLSTKIGPFDPSTVIHQPMSDTIVGVRDHFHMVENFYPPKLLSEIIVDLKPLVENHPSQVACDHVHHTDTHLESSSASNFEQPQCCFGDEGCFGDIIIHSTIMKSPQVCIYKGKLKNAPDQEEHYALKVYSKQYLKTFKLNNVIWEAKLGMELKHENICSVIGTIHTPT